MADVTKTLTEGFLPSPETPIHLVPSQFPSRFRPECLLGRGGQGEVWLAVDQELGQQVAVKLFNATISSVQRERMRREVRLGRRLQHPGLVRVAALARQLAPGCSFGGGVAAGGRLEARR